jgi:hypothetical protein
MSTTAATTTDAAVFVITQMTPMLAVGRRGRQYPLGGRFG